MCMSRWITGETGYRLVGRKERDMRNGKLMCKKVARVVGAVMCGCLLMCGCGAGDAHGDYEDYKDNEGFGDYGDYGNDTSGQGILDMRREGAEDGEAIREGAEDDEITAAIEDGEVAAATDEESGRNNAYIDGDAGHKLLTVTGTGFSAEYDAERIKCYRDVDGVDEETHFYYNNLDPDVVVGVNVRKEDGVAAKEFAQRKYDAHFGTDQSLEETAFGKGYTAVKVTYFEVYGETKVRVETYAVPAKDGCLIVEVSSSYEAGAMTEKDVAGGSRDVDEVGFDETNSEYGPALGGVFQRFLDSFEIE